jgi:hypothetical protein
LASRIACAESRGVLPPITELSTIAMGVFQLETLGILDFRSNNGLTVSGITRRR